jgi:hypothetical protein
VDIFKNNIFFHYTAICGEVLELTVEYLSDLLVNSKHRATKWDTSPCKIINSHILAKETFMK